MIMKTTIILSFMPALVSCVSNQPAVSSDGLAKLNDSPAVQFSTSGWSYTNTTNPFLLTPDYLTNAMIGVSRMKIGEEFPNNGPTVPQLLDVDTLQGLLTSKLSGERDMDVRTEVIGDYSAVVATYESDGKMGLEIAYELEGCLVHVLLLAKNAEYFESGKAVAYAVVKSMRPL